MRTASGDPSPFWSTLAWVASQTYAAEAEMATSRSVYRPTSAHERVGTPLVSSRPASMHGPSWRWWRRSDRRGRRDQEIRRILTRRQQRFERLRELLQDPRRTAFLIVLTAERLPVLETIELHAQLERTGVDVAGLVVNKRSPAGRGDFLDSRRAQEEVHLADLREALPSLPSLELPLLDSDIVGAQAVADFAAWVTLPGWTLL